jgi:hypothetical protein
MESSHRTLATIHLFLLYKLPTPLFICKQMYVNSPELTFMMGRQIRSANPDYCTDNERNYSCNKIYN